jgi:hypothetical protein
MNTSLLLSYRTVQNVKEKNLLSFVWKHLDLDLVLFLLVISSSIPYTDKETLFLFYFFLSGLFLEHFL